MESIYDISQRYNAITLLLEDGTIPQDDVNKALMDVMDDVVSKGENGIVFLHKQEALIEAAKNEKKKIEAYIKSREAVVKRTRQAYLYAMEQMGLKSIQTARGELKVKKNPPAVVIDDVAILPEDYRHTTINVTPDKAAIRTAIRMGDKVPGAHLEQAVSLSY